VPSTLALELATNPFLRSAAAPVRAVAAGRAGRELSADYEVFSQIRSWKVDYR
jgi:hydroxyacylglutathione hydrolase